MEDHQISFDMTPIYEKDLQDMTGAFMTGTSPKVLPLRRIGHYRYDSGNNKTIRKIMELYNNLIEKEIKDDILGMK